MELMQVRQAIKATPKGANIVCEWTRPCKTRKGTAAVITKSVRMVGRMGVEYDNLGAVQTKRDNGELPIENQGLPWGQWAEYPWLIEHKGKHYLRLYNGTSKQTFPKATFFMDGIEADKDRVMPFLLASELAEKDGDCFCCEVGNLTRINHETTEAVEELETV